MTVVFWGRARHNIIIKNERKLFYGIHPELFQVPEVAQSDHRVQRDFDRAAVYSDAADVGGRYLLCGGHSAAGLRHCGGGELSGLGAAVRVVRAGVWHRAAGVRRVLPAAAGGHPGAADRHFWRVSGHRRHGHAAGRH